ncbi:Sodium-dependent dopamine transporter [Schistosoma japonicum]|uniref:Transporter n=1 Tax=Schistosoma japonicum TaxID=6182 RepID=A0A4Z2DSC3_SCHJA|nr:Sodium-dependent dopamine transporter [Schistosoma japonicum]
MSMSDPVYLTVKNTPDEKITLQESNDDSVNATLDKTNIRNNDIMNSNSTNNTDIINNDHITHSNFSSNVSMNNQKLIQKTLSVNKKSKKFKLKNLKQFKLSNQCTIEHNHHMKEFDEEKSTNGGVNITVGKQRDKWNKKMDFLLSVIGFAVDLANVWRFPYLCYKNGGGAFLIPYGLMLIFGGIPLFYMELALGQFIRKGAITAWGRVCPLLKGVGYSVVLVAFYTDWFYNMIIAWSLYYFGASFTFNLPWMSCGNAWNTETCVDFHLINNDSDLTWGNVSMQNNYSFVGNKTFPVEEFFSNQVLGRTKDTNVENPGKIQWQVLMCFVAVMIICYFSLWKGIHTSGKVVWFTALFPYVVLMMFLFRGITLPGSTNGIYHYIWPNIEKLKYAEPWVDAATQIFFSLGPGFGVLMAYASYNEFHNNVYRDALLVATINSLTSLLSGFVVFTLLGYMAYKRNVLVLDVINDDPVLVFSVYPEALSTLPGSTYLSICFFLMLLTLGLDSSFGGSEAVITALSDEYPIIANHRELFVLGLFTFYVGVGALESTQGGIYWFHLFERTCVEYPILLAVLCETVCIAWIYGVDRFRQNIKQMLGFQPGIFWKICWKFIAPLFILFIVTFGLLNFQPLQLGDYTYPLWANLLGGFFSLSSILMIPIVAIIQILRTEGTFKERIKKLIKPVESLEMNDYQTENKQDMNNEVPISYSDTFNSIKSSSYLTKIQPTNLVLNCHQFNTNE